MMKYVVITSQYRGSYHSFIAKYKPDEFPDKARAMIKKLERYKRSQGETDEPVNYGDFTPEYFNAKNERFNVNDAGDIYFQLYSTVNQAVEEMLREQEHGQKFWDNDSENAQEISEHHKKSVVTNIVLEFFELI